MKKNFVLDTNVLINDPESIFKFGDNDLYIPIYVIEELDKLKSEQSIRGKNSRETCRILDDLRCQGSLSEGIELRGGGRLIIYVPGERRKIEVALDFNSMDNAILQCAMEVKERYGEGKPTILVTMDVNLRIRAEVIKLQTASYENQSVDESKLNSGIRDINVEYGCIDLLYKDKGLYVDNDSLFHNACLTLREPNGKTALARYYKDENIARPIILPKEGVFGIKPRNREQQFAFDLLLDDEIKLVILSGFAGTGKTLITCATGLLKVISEGRYNRFTVSRPTVPMGKDLGYLPGSLDEKISPWVQPVYDNLEFIMMSHGKKKSGIHYEEMFNQDLIRIEALTYIRGRTLPNQFILIDEAQNTNIHELKTIISRCGENTKIILTGDPDQIDSPYMDKSSCGISIAKERFHDNKMVGHLTLSKGERSELANLAASVL